MIIDLNLKPYNVSFLTVNNIRWIIQSILRYSIEFFTQNIYK